MAPSLSDPAEPPSCSALWALLFYRTATPENTDMASLQKRPVLLRAIKATRLFHAFCVFMVEDVRVPFPAWKEKDDWCKSKWPLTGLCVDELVRHARVSGWGKKIEVQMLRYCTLSRCVSCFCTVLQFSDRLFDCTRHIWTQIKKYVLLYTTNIENTWLFRFLNDTNLFCVITSSSLIICCSYCCLKWSYLNYAVV